MSDLEVKSDRLLELAGTVFSKGASESDRIELNEILLSDEAFRRCYLDYCRMHVTLRMELRARRAVLKAYQHINIGAIEAVSDSSDTVKTMAPVAITFPTLFHLTPTYFSSGWPLAYLIATVILGIGLLVGAVMRVSPTVQLADKSSHNSDQNLTAVPTPQSVGRVTGMVDCQFSDQATITFSGAYVSLGRRYVLSSGLMEITYDSGAKVILHGPCNYEVTGAASGHISIGRLTAMVDKRRVERDKDDVGVTVEHSASNTHGSPDHSRLTSPRPLPQLARPLFIVSTPTATVTDLGTEFGVEVSKNGDTMSHVFRGFIKFSSNKVEHGAAVERILFAGESLKYDAQRKSFSVVKLDPRRFITTLPNGSMNYDELVLSLRPTAYYRMERPADVNDADVVFDSAGGHHGVLHRGKQSTEPWRLGYVGGGLHLDGGAYVDVPSFPATESGQLSVVAWVYADRWDNWPNIASEQYARAWEDNPRRMQFGFGLVAAAGDLWAGVNNRDGAWCNVREGDGRSLRPGYWNQVAFVADGKTLRLYRGGQRVAIKPCDGVCLTPPIKHLMIGCKNWSQSPDAKSVQPMQFWTGRIDELAIFNRALSSEDVWRLFAVSKANHTRPSNNNSFPQTNRPLLFDGSHSVPWEKPDMKTN